MCLDSSFTLFRPIEKAVIRIRQSSIAGQPNAAGFYECQPGQYYFAAHYFWCDFYKKLHYFQCKVLYLQKNKLVWNSYTILSASNSP